MKVIISTSVVSDEVVNNSSGQFCLFQPAKRHIFVANYFYLDAVKTFCGRKKTISWQLTASI
jgi:hypothetical protein